MDWRRRLSRFPLGGVVLVVVSGLVALVFSTVNFGAGLGHVDIAVLSGSTGGNYAAVVDRLAARADKRGGTIENVSSQGSVDNIRRLVEGADSCDVHFALVQEGTPFPNPDDADKLELIGRLPRSETLFLIGKDAARLTKFEELRGMRVGVGPKGSGTEYLARSVFEAEDLKPLGLKLTNHELPDQIEQLASGALDLGVFVMDEDAVMIRSAIRDRRLELVSLEHLDVIPTRVSYLSAGVIQAGRYDALALIPARDHTVLRVDTLVIGNRCASRSVEIGLLRVLVEELPGFATKEGRGSLRRSEVAKEYLTAGPGFADEYVPWLVDIMPLGNWFYIVMSVSVLFNAMTVWHRVRLWRIDANRDKAFQIVRDALGEQLTPAEILVLQPTDAHANKRDQIDAAIRELDALRVTTRKHENSMLVPMGGEWMYRYEEEQMEAALTALRTFRSKLA
ncbi:MAG: hypothetical protein H0V17_21035 [Deltaproteobacteria bacterium]|nr:hypothetical protein [Deltaproteobacteria bacterium]